MKPIWIEIPVSDIHRAKVFYETVFGEELSLLDMGEFKMVLFPHGLFALCQHPQAYKPTTEGILLYLDGNPDLQTYLERIERSGGTILIPKRLIAAEQGYIALFTDTENNRIGLRSSQ